MVDSTFEVSRTRVLLISNESQATPALAHPVSQAHAIMTRQISARELLNLHLERINERNPQINAVVSLDEERAREILDESPPDGAPAEPAPPRRL